VEACPDVIKNLTMIMPDYKALFRYSDLTPIKPKLYKRIQHMVPFYLLRQAMIQRHHVESVTQEMINEILKKKVEIKKEAIPEAERKEEEQKAQEETAKKLHKLDKTVSQNWDLEFTFKLKEVNISLSADSNDKVRARSNE